MLEKRYKRYKLYILVLVAVFMLSLAGTASAAFSDVDGVHGAGDIYKLNSLGIIDGYPDGTFKPEADISRAEFAKIAVYTAGLQEIASSMTAVESTFTDLDSSEWYNGWINTAASRGFVKGYTDGTFRPEEKVTQSEVITIFLRILGYNDELKGNWPADYIAMASSLDILADITFVADQAASRAEVAILGSKTLDKNVVEYLSSDQVFKEKTDLKTNELYSLLYEKFNKKSGTENLLIGIDINEDYTTLLMRGGESLEMAADCVISGAAGVINLPGEFIDYIYNDKDEVIFIDAKNYGFIINDEIEFQDNISRVKAGDQNYPLAEVLECVDIDFNSVEDKVYNGTDVYILSLNSNDEVAMIRGITYPTPGIVDYVNTDKKTISFKQAPQYFKNINGLNFLDNAKNLAEKEYYIEKDSLTAELSDLKSGDAIWILDNYRGLDYYIVASSTRVSGILNYVKYMGDKIEQVNVDGERYNLINKAVISYDNGDNFEVLQKSEQINGKHELIDKKIDLIINPGGKVAAIIADTGEEESERIFGLVIQKLAAASVDGEIVDLLKIIDKNGDKKSYAIDDDTTLNKKEEKNIINNVLLQEGKMISFTLKDDKIIENIKTTDIKEKEFKTVDSDLDKVKIDGDWYDGTEISIFSYKAGEKDADILDWTDIEEHIDNGNSLLLSYYEKNKKIQYASMNNVILFKEKQYAVYVNHAEDSKGHYVEILLDNDIEKAYLDDDASESRVQTLQKGDLIEFTWQGTEIQLIGEAVLANNGQSQEITAIDINNNIIELGEETCLMNEDTLIFNCSDTDNLRKLEMSDLTPGDKISYIFTDNNPDKALKTIVIK